MSVHVIAVHPRGFAQIKRTRTITNRLPDAIKIYYICTRASAASTFWPSLNHILMCTQQYLDKPLTGCATYIYIYRYCIYDLPPSSRILHTYTPSRTLILFFHLRHSVLAAAVVGPILSIPGHSLLRARVRAHWAPTRHACTAHIAFIMYARGGRAPSIEWPGTFCTKRHDTTIRCTIVRS